MFDERRQRVTGIDKSYPLQPISTKTLPSNSGRQLKNTVIMFYAQYFGEHSLYWFILWTAASIWMRKIFICSKCYTNILFEKQKRKFHNIVRFSIWFTYVWTFAPNVTMQTVTKHDVFFISLGDDHNNKQFF